MEDDLVQGGVVFYEAVDVLGHVEHYDHHDEKAYGEEESTYIFLKDVPIEFPHNQKVIRYDLSV